MIRHCIRDLQSQGLANTDIADRLGLSVHQLRRRLAAGLDAEPRQPTRPPANGRPWQRHLPRVDPGPIPADNYSPAVARNLALPLAATGLPVRILNILERAGILTVWELIHCTREDLVALPSFGPNHLEHVLTVVRHLTAGREPPADDLSCERCGASADQIRHITIKRRGEEPTPKNKCLACGRVSEYMPTAADIRAECQAIRATWNPSNGEHDAPREARPVQGRAVAADVAGQDQRHAIAAA